MPEPYETLAAWSHLLSHGARAAILGLLRDRPRSRGELAEALGLQPGTVHRHLRLLEDGGLVRLDRPVTGRQPGTYRVDSVELARRHALTGEHLLDRRRRA